MCCGVWKATAKTKSARADLDRMVRRSQEWLGNGARAKGVFACSARGFWREYDLPARLAEHRSSSSTVIST